MKPEYVILVDEQDNEIGLMEKQEAHEKALLHRAFSVFIFNPENELLIQQRAFNKYHSGGLWTNTCCSHPRENELTIDAATRRLREEMGITCPLEMRFSFIYKTPLGNGLSEHELDFVYTGTYDGEPVLNTEEAASYKWITLEKLVEAQRENPHEYTTWFRIILQEYLQHL